MRFSGKKIETLPVEDINGNWGRVKVVRIPGCRSKFKGKPWISKGVNAKK